MFRHLEYSQNIENILVIAILTNFGGLSLERNTDILK